jgi:hypothetical protein
MSWLYARLHRVWTAVPWQGWVLLLAFYILSVVATHHTFSQVFSDSRYYLAWSYRYLGYSEVDAAHLTYANLVNMPGLKSCDFCWPPGYEHSFFHGEAGAVVGPRLMYPLLSAPFVSFMGPSGMLVVPFLAYGVGVLALAVLASRLWGRWWGVAAGLMIILPVVPARFATNMMTDALALMFNVLGLLFLPLRRDTRRSDVVWFSVVLILGLFTRQFAVTVTVGVWLAWLVVAIRDRRPRNPWLSFAISSAVVTAGIVQLQGFLAARFLGGSQLNLIDRYQQLTRARFHKDGLASVPTVLANLVGVDYKWVLRFETYLIIFLVVASVAAVWRFGSELSALLVGMAVPTLALTILIVDPTYFRYFVPLVPLMALAIVALVVDLTSSARRGPSRSTEAAPSMANGRPQPSASADRAYNGGGSWRLPVAAWTLLAGVLALAVFVATRRHVGVRIPALLIYAVVVVALILLAIRRAGPLAGVLTGLAMGLSNMAYARTLGSVIAALVLLAIVVCLAVLPGSGFDWGRRAVVAFAISLSAALVMDYRAVALAVAVVVVWLLTSVSRRNLRNVWMPFGLVALAAGGLTLAVDLLLPLRHTYYRQSWLARDPTQLPAVFKRVVTVQLWQISTDRVLYLVCALLVVAVVMRWRQQWTVLAAATAGSSMLLLVIRGSADSFATLMVAYPLVVLVVTELVSRLAGTEGSNAVSLKPSPPATPRTGGARPSLGGAVAANPVAARRVRVSPR